MWNNSVCGESISPPAPAPPIQSGMLNMNVDYFYRQPTCTYYTYYDYLVVIDFEATCDDTRNDNPRPIRHERPEIIQFPALLVNVRTMKVDSFFNKIVKPVEAPKLTDFCTKLTGITQEEVNQADTFPCVLRKFENWLKSHGIALNNHEYGHTFAIVTDGAYDMGHFLYKQCIISQIPFPQYANRWVNIGTIFTKVYRRRWLCLKKAMEYLGLPFEGRAHNGLDDSKNICKVLMRLLHTGCVIHQTEKILLQPEDQERNEVRILNDKSAGKYDLATVAPILSKDYEHILVFSTDVWSTQRVLGPELVREYSLEPSYDSNESMMMMNTSDYCTSPHQQTASSGSCESIASGCSNKENSIPIYIPSPTKSPTSPLKSRPSPGVNEVITVSAAGVGTGSPTGSPVVTTSGRHGGRRKKRNAQLKDPSNNGSQSSGSGAGGGSGSGIKTSDDEVVAKVASELSASSSEISHLRSHLQPKALDSDGSSIQHLQPLVSDLRTEE